MIWVGCVITGVAAADLTTIHVEWYKQYPRVPYRPCGRSKKSCDIHIPVHSERAKTFALLHHYSMFCCRRCCLAHEQSRILNPPISSPSLEVADKVSVVLLITFSQQELGFDWRNAWNLKKQVQQQIYLSYPIIVEKRTHPICHQLALWIQEG